MERKATKKVQKVQKTTKKVTKKKSGLVSKPAGRSLKKSKIHKTSAKAVKSEQLSLQEDDIDTLLCEDVEVEVDDMNEPLTEDEEFYGDDDTVYPAD